LSQPSMSAVIESLDSAAESVGLKFDSVPSATLQRISQRWIEVPPSSEACKAFQPVARPLETVAVPSLTKTARSRLSASFPLGMAMRWLPVWSVAEPPVAVALTVGKAIRDGDLLSFYTLVQIARATTSWSESPGGAPAAGLKATLIPPEMPAIEAVALACGSAPEPPSLCLGGCQAAWLCLLR
jgi:hypothetical protein